MVGYFTALLSFRGFGTPSLPAQGEQRLPLIFNIQRGNAASARIGKAKVTEIQGEKTPTHRAEMGPVSVSLFDNLDTLRSRADEWNSLVKSSATNTVFQTFEWHDSWWKAFGQDSELLVLLAESDKKLVGIAPLMLSQERLLLFNQKTVNFIGAYTGSDYCDFITDKTRPEILLSLLLWLLEHKQRWDVLRLQNIPDLSDTSKRVASFFRRFGHSEMSYKLVEAPTRLLKDPVEDEKLLKKKSLKQHFNYFNRNGKLELKNYNSAEDILKYMGIFFQQHIERWAMTETPSQFLCGRQKVFYERLVKALAPKGWLVFSVVLFKDQPLAFHLGFEYAGRFIFYKPTFNVKYREHSPGKVLIKLLLEYALERGLEEFDFTIGEELYKYQFANHVRVNYEVRVFRHQLHYWTHRLYLTIKGLIKRYPPLARRALALRNRWRKYSSGTAARVKPDATSV